MRKVVIAFLLCWILFFATLIYLGEPAEAADWLELQDLTVTYRSYLPGGSEPMITQNSLLADRHLDKGLDLSIHTLVFDLFYWDSLVRSLTDQDSAGSGQFRAVGLEMDLGVDFRRLYSQFPVRAGYHHDSRHYLDTASPYHFPVNDSLQLQIIIYDRRSR